MAPQTVLLTGFEPFADDTINPSWEAVRQLDGWQEAGFIVVARQLPCVFGTALDALDELVGWLNPQIVIAVGQAGRRADISVERVAINVDDARIPDNAGRQPVDEPIAADGPAAYFSTLPIKAIVHALRAAGIPASVSQTAGTFVCNHVFYGAARLAATRYPAMRAGFIHIPFLPEQAVQHPGTPSLALDTAVEALRVAVRVSVGIDTDIRESGGQID
ncbi:MAG: pyroglutamyl-peptidase I [Burkholderiales bacterium]|nr:pyroglutamyl-peptidase I [Burkholderiales bacterium]